MLLNKYLNGNHYTYIFDDGTRIRKTKDNSFTYDFPENFDMCITKYCDNPICQKYCHECASPQGKHCDISKLKFLDTLTPGTEVALGGGNTLAHPQLEDLCKILKDKGVITNITVNQYHFNQNKYRDILCELSDNNFVKGIGISINSLEFNNFKYLMEKGLNNVVLHFIAGINNFDFIKKSVILFKDKIKYVYDIKPKILILGYKDFGNGNIYNKNYKDEIDKNIKELSFKLKELKEHCRTISFDCLAIKQLDPKTNFNMSDEEYDLNFQGDDYSDEASTMYIDAVNMEIARCSTEPARFKFNGDENIVDLFKKTLMK